MIDVAKPANTVKSMEKGKTYLVINIFQYDQQHFKYLQEVHSTDDPTDTENKPKAENSAVMILFETEVLKETPEAYYLKQIGQNQNGKAPTMEFWVLKGLFHKRHEVYNLKK